MRTLRFVHLAGDGSHLVLETADGGEQFALTADAQVRDALAAGRHRQSMAPIQPVTETQPEPQPQQSPAVEISPREIQIRVRAGESPADVAASLGTTPDRIARFAGPVVEERRRIADEARRGRTRRGSTDNRSTADAQLVVFGEVVDERFAAHGVAPSEVSWDSYRRDDGDWVVRAEWRRGETSYEATWQFHRASRTVTALDDAAGDLLSDRPIRPAMPTKPVVTVQSGVVAFPPMPEALTGPLPVIEDVFDQDADDPDAPRVLTSRAFGYSEPFDDEPLAFEEPPLPLGIVDPNTRPGTGRLSSVRNLSGGKHQESDEERAARVKVPSWDDILLGVRRKQD